jgi:hypothetical protein
MLIEQRARCQKGLPSDCQTAVKELVAKLSPSGDLSSEAFFTGLLEFRNMPHESGSPPDHIAFGHQLRSILPAHRSSHASQWKEAIAAR